ncbi:MAG TPA: hypothetical protein G4O07_00100 [Dehalococcoidia bacterium]|nr:hypothetical protein [Dehalococcoidia bacterium]
MSGNGNGLPQAVIDEMFDKQVPRQENTLPEASVAVLSNPVDEQVIEDGKIPAIPSPDTLPDDLNTTAMSPATPNPDDEVLKIVQNTMHDLLDRMVKLETCLDHLEEKQNTTADFGAAILQLEEKLCAVIRHLDRIDSRVMTVTKKLQDTPSYGVRDDFTCGSCGSQGFAAIPLKCTSCGKEGWWGWWPK